MSLRDLPAVDELLRSPGGVELVEQFGRPLATDALRCELEEARGRVRKGGVTPSPERLIEAARARLKGWTAPQLRPVINATGVVLHTNLGRAPLSDAALRAMRLVARGYSNLEFDLERGQRGHRDQQVEVLLTRLTGAEAALVVNNNAAAVLLALRGLAEGKEALISRTQLVEIGGGFRMPEVLAQSGARLIEVGTTNRTHLRDYEDALGENSGVIVRAHRSNFQLVGFTTEPPLSELAEFAQRAGLPLVDDLGSGTLLDSAEFGLAHEPTVQESLQQGASLVTFSGDKLLGGPQAGLVCGERDLVDRLRRHPLARALRPDKLCLAALTATLLHYLKDEATEKIPMWRMIGAQSDSLRARAESWRQELGFGEVIEGQSAIGGGSLPGERLSTWLWSLAAEDPDAWVAQLRTATPPVVGRIEEGRVCLDPRTVLPEQDPDLLQALTKAAEEML